MAALGSFFFLTAIATILVYALLVMGVGTTHERALMVSVMVAVLLPIVMFRWARALLLALDNSVNANQSYGNALRPEDAADADAEVGLNLQRLTRLKADDGNAGCVMGVALAMIPLFGLLMGGVKLSFVTSQSETESGRWESEPLP